MLKRTSRHSESLAQIKYVTRSLDSLIYFDLTACCILAVTPRHDTGRHCKLNMQKIRTRPRHTRKPWSVFTHNRSKSGLSNDHTFSCGLSQLQGYFENATICLISFLIPPWLCSFFLLLETSHCFCRGMCSHDARTCADKLCDAGISNHCEKKCFNRSTPLAQMPGNTCSTF